MNMNKLSLRGWGGVGGDFISDFTLPMTFCQVM